MAATMTEVNCPPPLIGETIVERTVAARSRDPDFRAAACYCYYNGKWWSKCRQTWIIDRPPQEDEMTVSEAISMLGGGMLLYVKIDKETDPNKPRRRCLIGQFLGPDVVSLIKLAPNNATFRARVMAVVGEMPPKELDTFEKIKDWVEFTFPKDGAPQIGTRVLPPENPPLEVRYGAEETEYGRCRFSRQFNTRDTFRMTHDEVVQVIRESDDMDDAIRDIIERMESHAQNSGNREEVSESTECHEVDDGSGVELDYSLSDLKGYIRRAARTVIAEDDWEDYGLV